MTKLSEKFSTILNKKQRTALIQQFLKEFAVSMSTVQNWLYGRNTPNRLYWRRIAEIMGTEVSELFPVEDNNSEVTKKTL